MRLFSDNYHGVPVRNHDEGQEYERFLLLKLKEKDFTYPFKLYPSLNIDRIWKAHVQETESYKKTFEFLPFIPYTSKMHKESLEERKKKYEHTLELYDMTFDNMNTNYWYPDSNQSGDGCCLCKKQFGFEAIKYNDNSVYSETERHKSYKNRSYKPCHLEHQICISCYAHLDSNNCPICKQDRFNDEVIQVFTLTGGKLFIPAKLTYTVELLKILIQDADGVPPDQQRLIYAGRQLEDDITLEEYKINYGSIVHLVLRLTGC